MAAEPSRSHRFSLLLSLALFAACAHAQRAVDFRSEDGTSIHAYYFRPSGPGPFPAVVALHGCAGLTDSDGALKARELDWGRRLASAGYLVVYPDSFGARGITESCTRGELKDFPRVTRPQDARGALAWLRARADVRGDRVALMGWSNGGSSLLWTIGEDSGFRTAIAFYPGCLSTKNDAAWTNRIPLQILMGELDDWTIPAFCQELATRSASIQITLYPDSYHDFDSPNLPITVRHGLSGGRSGTIGTNERARAQAIQKTLEILSSALR